MVLPFGEKKGEVTTPPKGGASFPKGLKSRNQSHSRHTLEGDASTKHFRSHLVFQALRIEQQANRN
jgi:hypothetical protein